TKGIVAAASACQCLIFDFLTAGYRCCRSGQCLHGAVTRTIRRLVILIPTMKSLSIGIAALLASASVLANADHVRDAREAVPAAAGVMPISIDGGEPRAPMRLRDALRQP